MRVWLAVLAAAAAAALLAAGASGVSGDDTITTFARIYAVGIGGGQQGTVYVVKASKAGEHTLQKIDAGGTITTIVPGCLCGFGTIGIDGQGRVYVAGTVYVAGVPEPGQGRPHGRL